VLMDFLLNRAYDPCRIIALRVTFDSQHNLITIKFEAMRPEAAGPRKRDE
jgi:hypothetical protein